jgi:hypothetical protein
VVKPERIQEKETKPNIRPKGKKKGKFDGIESQKNRLSNAATPFARGAHMG